LLLPTTLIAQGQTETRLNDGIKFYQSLETGRARDVFLGILSPSWQFEVSRDQRVKAYKYLGAVLATEGQKDSAQIYFRAALERDPFTDLETSIFSQQERQAFAESKRNVFKVGAKPIVADTLDPKTGRLTITTITTHGASFSIQVVGDSEPAFPLFAGDNDGLKTVQWNGTNMRNLLVPPGQYEIVVKGQSSINRQQDSTKLYFDVQHLHDPLQDTLVALKETDFLPERHPENSARNALLLGFSVAGAALAIPSLGSGGSLGVSRTPALGISALSLATGLLAFVNRQSHPEIPENVAANQLMRTRRLQSNQRIVAANDAKLAATKLIITPIVLAGAAQ
jgi:hypothetical protein